MATHVVNAELEAAIAANVDDVASFLVYGDWLSERGDPRGELVAVQTKLRETPGDAALLAKEKKLLDDNKKAWLGDLADLGPNDVAFTWLHGFLASVRIGPPLDEYETSEIDFPETYATFMALPGTGFVREIVVGSKSNDDSPTTWSDVLEAMGEHGLPRALRRLEFNRGGYWDISWTELGDLSVLYPQLQSLRELAIEMGSMDFGASMALPALRSLSIVTCGLTKKNVASIASARWPSLQRLSLYVGETGNDYGCDVALDDLAPLLDARTLPKVRHLGVANASFADDVPAALARSTVLPQLETLDLSHGSFGDDGAEALLASAAAFRHLKRIDLTRSYVSDDAAARLRELGPEIVLEDQQDPGEDGEDRYVSVSE